MNNIATIEQTIPAEILIVDYEEQTRYILERNLTRDGFVVTTTTSGFKTLTLVKQHTFDLILMDITLPDIGGLELLTTLHQQVPDTVIIVLTGNRSLQTSIKSLYHGAHDYLIKPCKPAHLWESIRSGLYERQQKLKQRQLLTQLDQLTQSISDLTNQEMVPPLPDITTVTSYLPQSPSRFIKHGRVMIDTLHHVITVDNNLLDVTTVEFDMLFYLITNTPRIISPIELVGEVLGYRNSAQEAKHVTRQYIYRLRQKIKETAKRDDVIRTVRGHGYTINPHQ